MEGKLMTSSIILSFFLTITSFSISTSTPLQYQALLLTSLPIPTQHQPESESKSFTPTNTNTLSLDLHHVDTFSTSPSSTAQSLFNLRLHRDALRAKALSARAAASSNNATARGGDFGSPIISGLAQGSGEYFTRLGVGTPAKQLYVVLDTGSDVVWVQCSPCRNCYSQSDPLFDPANSTSFLAVTCLSPICRRLDSSGCNTRKNNCLYQVSYGDGSFTVGDFSTETLTFRNTRVTNIALGCGHDNEGLFVGAAGLMGLGRGKLSFPTQAGSRFGKKFSYCLMDRSGSGKPSSLEFGESAISRGTVFTPLLTNPKLDTFYYVGLTGISVGGARVRGIGESMFRVDAIGNGGVIVDSGTSVTRLTQPAYVALRDAFRAGASGLRQAGEFSLFDTCYDLSGRKEVKVPTVVLHFAGRGADVSLPASNYLIPVDNEGKFCFAFAGTKGGLSIIGNIQQQGFRVVFDLAGNRVGFAPRGCA